MSARGSCRSPMRRRLNCRLGRLLRLSLFQVSVGLAVVLLIGTLNRVMIVELGVPAWLVAVMISLPLVFAPFRALVGFRSDTHRSVLGWRRVPYIWMGTLIQFGGLAIMPFALIVLSGDTNGPIIFGQIGAALSFLLVGAGLHTTQTVGLALATDLAPPKSHPRVVALLCMMLLLGMVGGALTYGALLAHFTEIKLIQVIQGTALATMLLNIVGAMETGSPRSLADRPRPDATNIQGSLGTLQRDTESEAPAFALGLGTVAFSMQDILLEPYGGQVLHLTVGTTTILSALLATGGLSGFGLAARLLGRGTDPYRLAAFGALVGLGRVQRRDFRRAAGVHPAVRHRHRADRFRCRTVRALHVDRRDGHRPSGSNRPGPGRLGRGPGVRRRIGRCRRRPDPRRHIVPCVTTAFSVRQWTGRPRAIHSYTTSKFTCCSRH